MLSGERALKAAGAAVCPVPPCEIAAAPLRLLKLGCKQLAFPLLETPVAQLLVPH